MSISEIRGPSDESDNVSYLETSIPDATTDLQICVLPLAPSIFILRQLSFSLVTNAVT